MPTGVIEQKVLSVDQVFHLFPLKIWDATLHESCVLNKLDNFHKGRFLSV
jgi:hypothetical protein